MSRAIIVRGSIPGICFAETHNRNVSINQSWYERLMATFGNSKKKQKLLIIASYQGPFAKRMPQFISTGKPSSDVHFNKKHAKA